MPTTVDIVFAVLFAILLVALDAWYFLPRDRRRIAAGAPTARWTLYRRTIIGEWVVALAAILLWAREGRSWGALGLQPPTDWRLVTGLALAVVTAALAVRQAASIRRFSSERLEKIRPRLASVDLLEPRTAAEYRWFMALSITAGVCEELLYRGFLTWLLASYMPLVLAIIIVSIAFGFGHGYQGVKGIVKTGTVGLIMSLIVLASGWLIPAMVIHAILDISGGIVSFRVLGPRVVRPA